MNNIDKKVFNCLPQDITEFKDGIFKDCDLSQHDLTSYDFVDCTFINCDFSMAIIEHVTFNDVRFEECKLIGLDFSKCSKFLFTVSFEECLLDYCLFLNNKMKKTVFKNCSMKEMTFAECELAESVFDECELARTMFERCNLEKCDFSSAYNYELMPSQNKIKKAKFAYPGVLGLLSDLDIKVVE